MPTVRDLSHASLLITIRRRISRYRKAISPFRPTAFATHHLGPFRIYSRDGGRDSKSCGTDGREFPRALLGHSWGALASGAWPCEVEERNCLQ